MKELTEFFGRLIGFLFFFAYIVCLVLVILWVLIVFPLMMLGFSFAKLAVYFEFIKKSELPSITVMP